MDLCLSYGMEPKKVDLSEGFRKDLQSWSSSLEYSNGILILDDERRTIKITMDGSTKGEVGERLGLGAFNFETNEYFHTPIPDWFPVICIADYELLVHVIAGIVWWPTLCC